MASGMSTDEPPPLPPPDYTHQTTEEFAKSQMPPLRGLIVDPKYPPTATEAAKVFPTKNDASNSNQIPPDNQQEDANIRRSSGASQIFSAAPTTSEVINTMPGGTYHTPGGLKDTSTPSLTDGIKSLSPTDVSTFHTKPCVRESLLQGMAAGFLLGGAMLVTGRTVWRASNVAVWTFVPTTVAGWGYCQYQRRREREGMKAAVRIVEAKKEEKRALMEERRERVRLAREERARREEEERARVERERRWWRFWEGRGREG